MINGLYNNFGIAKPPTAAKQYANMSNVLDTQVGQKLMAFDDNVKNGKKSYQATIRAVKKSFLTDSYE